MDDTLYTIFNTNNEILAFGARMTDEVAENGMRLFRTGSASLWSSKWHALEKGDKVHHWMYKDCEVIKINRKSITLLQCDTDDLISLKV